MLSLSMKSSFQEKANEQNKKLHQIKKIHSLFPLFPKSRFSLGRSVGSNKIHHCKKKKENESNHKSKKKKKKKKEGTNNKNHFLTPIHQPLCPRHRMLTTSLVLKINNKS